MARHTQIWPDQMAALTQLDALSKRHGKHQRTLKFPIYNQKNLIFNFLLFKEHSSSWKKLIHIECCKKMNEQ